MLFRSVAREAEQRKRRRVQLALAGALSLLVLGGGAFAWWRDHEAIARRWEEDGGAVSIVALLLEQLTQA